MRIAFLRAVLSLAALAELGWSLVFYLRPESALAALGRSVIDPVIARQYPLYLASAALAYGLAARDPLRYRLIVLVCVAQRAVELVVALIDRRAHAIATTSLVVVAACEIALATTLLVLLPARVTADRAAPDPRDLGLRRLLRGFGALEVFWFLASTVFVQLGSRLLHWKLQDPYTTQQMGIALLVIGLTSLVAGSDVARYRVFVWVPVASQLIGVANSFNEVHLGSIGWSTAAVQWTIELAICGAIVYLSRQRIRVPRRAPALAER